MMVNLRRGNVLALLLVGGACHGERTPRGSIPGATTAAGASSMATTASAGVGGAGGAGGAVGSGGGVSSAGGTAPACARSVLFIGNSYTAYHQLPELVAGFASADGCALVYDTSAPGGARFLTHVDDPTTQAKIDAQPWDAVVLQNQSQVPGWRPEDVTSESLPHAVTLAAQIDTASPGAQLLYFSTWGRRDGDTANCEYYPLVCDFDGHTTALTEGYTIYADGTGGTIAPVGEAWRAVVDDASAPFPPSELWVADGSHPSLRGSYLAAAVIYAALFEQSPVGSTFTAGLDATEVTYLQARSTVAP